MKNESLLAFEKLMKDKSKLKKLFYENRTIGQCQRSLGFAMQYYIATRDTEFRTLNEMKNNFNFTLYPKKIVVHNAKNGESLNDTLNRNIFEEGFVSHTFNHYNYEQILKYGLGSKKILDPELEKDIQKMESIFGENSFKNRQPNDDTEIYYSMPDKTMINYMLFHTPERLTNGPLKQKDHEMLPVMVGETTIDYYKKVAMFKLLRIYSVSQAKKHFNSIENVIEKFFEKPPMIALIPINGKTPLNNTSLERDLFYDTTISQTLPETIKSKGLNIEDSLFGKINIQYPPILDDAVSVGVNIPPEEMQFIEGIGLIDFITEYALAKGYKYGETINCFNGKHSINFQPKTAKDKIALESVYLAHDFIKNRNRKLGIKKINTQLPKFRCLNYKYIYKKIKNYSPEIK